MSEKIGIIILAGGKGTRMNQEIPKVLTEINGVTLIEKLLRNVEKFFDRKEINIVVGFKGEDVINKLQNRYNFIWQKEQLGTGHAVMQCRESLEGKYKSILILYGDTPFITENTLRNIIELHEENNYVFSMITLKLDNFENTNSLYWKFGRIIRDENGKVLMIVEFKDATEYEKNVTEVNPAIYCVKDDWLWNNLENIDNNNFQKEYYLTDLVFLANKQGVSMGTLIVRDNLELMGINSQEDLEIAKKIHN
ncbi:MAG TPA: NTP transferase domain-containing protein [bacterium]|jgi:bifunctional UDP-N-acetylglucosamine pyrophosphorylase/glucosamine-1-phosphate N-acetyltransferase|nr:NTP transferase domain-containing protein [bacterium]HOG38634.1 NTP transferase domain-containing protein [bacterium]HQI03450.1 NTP transferase domain-containing protein [bacterium]